MRKRVDRFVQPDQFGLEQFGIYPAQLQNFNKSIDIRTGWHAHVNITILINVVRSL